MATLLGTIAVVATVFAHRHAAPRAGTAWTSACASWRSSATRCAPSASPRWPPRTARAPSCGSPPKGFMQQIVDKLDLRAQFDNEELRNKLKTAGLRGQAPLVAYMFFRVAAPPIVFCVALFYLFVMSDLDYSTHDEGRDGARRGHLRLLSAQHLRREPGPEAPAVDQAGVSRFARHAAHLRAVGHVGRGRVRQGREGDRRSSRSSSARSCRSPRPSSPISASAARPSRTSASAPAFRASRPWRRRSFRPSATARRSGRRSE